MFSFLFAAGFYYFYYFCKLNFIDHKNTKKFK